MNQVDILEHLDLELPQIGTEIRNIDCGGCGIFALELFNQLKNVGLEPTIQLVSSYYCIGGSEALKELRETYTIFDRSTMGEYNLNVAHIMVSLDGKLIDSNGVFNDFNESEFSDSCYLAGDFPVIALEYLLSSDSDMFWNPTFNIDNIPKLKGKINEAFENFNIN